MTNNNHLKKISENFYIKKDELYNDILLLDQKKAKRISYHPLRRLTALLVALSVILGGCITAYAVSPEFRNYLNLWFMTNSQQQKTVPDGYTGIYTLEDLNDVRNDLSGKYIMMNDLTFLDSDFTDGGAYAGGWVAMGNENTPFTGIFDGNGYVINDLVLNTNGNFIGLFGKASFSTENTISDDVRVTSNEPIVLHKVVSTTSDDISATSDIVSPVIDVNSEEIPRSELSYEGIIKNLGLAGVTVNVTINNDNYSSASIDDEFIGTIAAYGNYIVDCYADNVKIIVTVEDFVPMAVSEDQSTNESNGYINMNIGGLCGNANMIDSCYTNADINIINKNNNVGSYAGGIAAIAKIVVTSYFDGNITIDGEDFNSNKLLACDSFLPNLMTEKRISQVVEAIKAGANPRSASIFKAYYTSIKPSQREKDLLFSDKDDTGKCYILEPRITIKEIRRLEKLILLAYSDEEFRQGTTNDGVKARINYCYTLDEDTSYDQSHFEQFDFDNIWVMKDGVPKLQIFQ